MSRAHLFPIASLFIFALSTPVICDACEVSNLPEFRDNPEHRLEEGLDSGISAIVPSYTFSCAGYVTQWRAHMEGRTSRYDRYELTFSVWRRRQTNESCAFIKIGENSPPGHLVPEIDANSTSLGTVTLNVKEKEQILVEPGDVVGFQVQHYEADRGGEMAGAASVMADVSRTDVIVYMSTSPLPSEIECFDQRTLFGWTGEDGGRHITAAALAPVITMEIEQLASTTFSTSVTSTARVPSPSIAASVHPAVSTSVSIVPATTSTPVTIIPTVSVISPTISTDEADTGTTTTIIIIATMLVVMAALSFMFLASLCVLVVAARKKKHLPSQDNSDHGSMEMCQNHVYSIHNSYTMPDHYKREDSHYPGYSAIYDTVSRAEPLPRLNPTLSSCSAEGPAFLSHSESVSSQAEDYELLYSVVSPFHSTDREQMKRISSIDCPLYLSLTSAAESTNIYDVPVQDHTYNILTRPDDPAYHVSTTDQPDESSLDKESLERAEYMVPASCNAEQDGTYEVVSDVRKMETSVEDS